MSRNTLPLQLWQAACRHIEIAESLESITPALARHLTFAALALRRLDPGLPGWDTAAGSREGRPLPRSVAHCSGDAWRRANAWCARREVLRTSAPALAREHAELLPPGFEGALLCAGLAHQGEPIGALLLEARPGEAFTPEHAALTGEVLEPLAVALENDRRLRELAALREVAEADRSSLLRRLGRTDLATTIVGAQTGLRDVMLKVDQVGRSDVPVLILGETGTGKEVVARAIHERSRRARAPFLRVNCGAIPGELIDSELFGHERGSFTGATDQRKGWFERADGGTLFLDEVAELTPAAQVRLLRILQDGSFERVGGQRVLSVDVRLVAATNRDLHAMVEEGSFRQDLWYRIAVFPIPIPPLRERTHDVPPLAIHFALRAAERLGLPPQIPTLEQDGLLARYPWPGNVRELASVMERAAILGEGHGLAVEQALGVPAPRAPGGVREAAPAQASAFATLDETVARHVEAALARTAGRIEGRQGAARLLDINPHTLRARMRKLGIDWRRFREQARGADGGADGYS